MWIDGVNPGAIALGAKTLNETPVELRNTLARVFIDFAREALDFDDFKARVEAFFEETDVVGRPARAEGRRSARRPS